jgi:hypothetical protein
MRLGNSHEENITLLYEDVGFPGLAKNADGTRVRRINKAKNGFHQLSDFEYREDRESFFATCPANEGLGVFSIAEVFFPAFFFKKKADPRGGQG